MSSFPTTGYDENSFLYVFHCDGFHKVGISKNQRQRIAHLQSMNPHKLTLVLFRRVSAQDAFFYEGTIHKLLENYRVHGEWFSAPLDLIRRACRVATKELPLRAEDQRKWEEFCATREGRKPPTCVTDAQSIDIDLQLFDNSLHLQ